MQADPDVTPSMPADGTSLRLPPELMAMIIDHLHNDFSTLDTCSIVCSSWSSMARYHLFHSTYVECEDGSWDHLTEFLANSTSSVADSIREIHISSGPIGRIGEPHFGIVRPYLLIYLLDRLEHLHTIVLERVYWQCSMELEMERFLRGWPPVPRPLKTLRLDDVMTYDEEGSSRLRPPLSARKIGLLQLFSSIQHLDILSATAEVFLDNPAAMPGGIVHAWTLRDCDTPTDLHRSLSGVGSLKCLESLSIDVPNPSSLEAEKCFEIIYDISATLKSLDIEYLGTPTRSLPPGTDIREWIFIMFSTRRILIDSFLRWHTIREGEAAVWNRLRLTERQSPLLQSLALEIELRPEDPFLFQLYDLVYPTDVDRKDPTLWPYIISLSQRGPPLVKSLTVKHRILINHGLGPRRRYDVDDPQDGFVVDIINLVDWPRVISALNGWRSLEEVCVHVKVCIFGKKLRYGEDRRVQDTLRKCLQGLSPSIRLVLQLDPPIWL